MKWTDAKSCASVCNFGGVGTPLVSATLRPPESRGRVLLQHGFQISIPQGFFVARYGNGVRRHHPLQRKERVIWFRSLFHQLRRKRSDGFLTQPYLRVHVPLPRPMFQHLHHDHGGPHRRIVRVHRTIDGVRWRFAASRTQGQSRDQSLDRRVPVSCWPTFFLEYALASAAFCLRVSSSMLCFSLACGRNASSTNCSSLPTVSSSFRFGCFLLVSCFPFFVPLDALAGAAFFANPRILSFTSPRSFHAPFCIAHTHSNARRRHIVRVACDARLSPAGSTSSG